MNLAELSIRRPIFIVCLVILLLTVGYISICKLPVNLFPNVTFPVVMIHTTYPGASPEEVETLVSKPLEDNLNSIPGIKQLISENTEGKSQVVIEFTSDTDIKYAEQQVRDKVSQAKGKLPTDIEEPVIRRIDPADKPILILSLNSPLPRNELYELADKTIKQKIEQINQVGMVEIVGSSGREIHVDLDRNKLIEHGISADDVSNRIASAGQNVPVGKIDQGQMEKVFRAVGEYHSVQDIGNVIVNFFGNDVPVTVNTLGTVTDGFAENQSKTYVDGKPALLLMVYQQTGSNTIEVVNKINKRLTEINTELKNSHIPVIVKVTRDGSSIIRGDVTDVVESILIGIVLTIVVVYLFLGTARSTFITGLALPTSLIGAFSLMYFANFSINTMSLLALSLAVGLLVDDAIVVRENIFRHAALGKTAVRAAIDGTKEVLLAVIATSLTVIAVFGPIGFLQGIVGSFFKEFGLTVCFAMMISLFDAITIAPMLSAYIGLKRGKEKQNRIVASFQSFQTRLEHTYEKVLHFVLRFPKTILFSALMIFVLSIVAAKFVSKTFLPAQDHGEFMISCELPSGKNLQAMDEVAQKIDQTLLHHKEVATAVAIVGSRGEPNKAQFFINMVPSKQRKISTTDFKQLIRDELKQFSGIKVVVGDIDLVGGGERPFNLNITGDDAAALKDTAFKVYEQLKKHPGLLDPEISYKSGKPELEVQPILAKLQNYGVSAASLGQELRTQVEGSTAAVYRENGNEYNIRVRLNKDQRDLEQNFNNTYIPNINHTLVKLNEVARATPTLAPAKITRNDRKRYIQISADIAPNGPGMGGVMQDIDHLFATKIKLPAGMSYTFKGQAESFNELTHNMIIAISLGVLFIYLVLASLYESFVTPLTIMLVLPLAACGAFFGLLITQHSLDIFSMIGCIMLFGIATKNSILLVDYTKQLTAQGYQRKEAIIKAGVTRLRPILMTTIALIAGMLPIAIGLNEASKQRTSMGVTVISGLISSTLLTLIVVPAAYAYIEKFRVWCTKLFKRVQQKETVSESEYFDTPTLE